MAKRVVIVVDGTNLYMSMKDNDKVIWPPELKDMLLPHVGGDIRDISQIHYFTSVDRKNKNQQRALNKMGKQGLIVYDFDLRFYPDLNPCTNCNDKCSKCGRDLREKAHKEKMIDIAIATKAIELAHQKEPNCYDTFIIVTGDKDLIPAIRLLRQKLGKEVIVAGFRHQDSGKNNLAYELDKEVNKIINFNEIM